MKPNGKGKLSKRDGDKDGYPVFPLNWGKDTPGFREMGFLPQAMINYLALLGWNDGTENELFTLKELESKFSVEGVQKGGARFDYEKAKWVNHQKITQADTQELLEFKSVKENLTDHPSEKHALLVDLVKERLYKIGRASCRERV